MIILSTIFALKEINITPIPIVNLTISIRPVTPCVVHLLHSPFSPKIDFMVDLQVNKKIRLSYILLPLKVSLHYAVVTTTENHCHEATEFLVF